MLVSIIAAISKNLVIGNAGTLPWYIPEDLQWFKKHTLNKPTIMGKHTYLSIGKALPNRINIVLTKDLTFQAPNCLTFTNLETALREFKKYPEIMIAGGESLYKQTLPIANKLYLTLIDEYFVGDTFFPEINSAIWQETFKSSHTIEAPQTLKYQHLVLEKIKTLKY